MRFLGLFTFGVRSIFATAMHGEQNELDTLMMSKYPSVSNDNTINGVIAFFAKTDSKCASAPVSYLSLSWHTCYGPLADYQFKVVSVDPDKKVYVFGTSPCSQSAGSIVQPLNRDTCYTPIIGYNNITTAVMLPPGSVDTTVPTATSSSLPSNSFSLPPATPSTPLPSPPSFYGYHENPSGVLSRAVDLENQNWQDAALS